MARRSNRGDGSNRRPGPSLVHRVAFSSPVQSPLPRLSGLDQARSIVRALEDRRTWHPAGPLRPAGASSRSSRRFQVSESSTRSMFPSAAISFARPDKVSMCVRRKTRREVIFAKRKHGKGAGAPRRRNWFSDIGC